MVKSFYDPIELKCKGINCKYTIAFIPGMDFDLIYQGINDRSYEYPLFMCPRCLKVMHLEHRLGIKYLKKEQEASSDG